MNATDTVTHSGESETVTKSLDVWRICIGGGNGKPHVKGQFRTHVAFISINKIG